MKRKICVVTGTRADYGFLSELMKLIKKDRFLKLQVIATGTHLSRLHGLSYRAVESDGFKIDVKIPILSRDDSPAGIACAIGKAVDGFGRAFSRLKPELIVLLGDRYETLAAAQAALVSRIPVAHIAGGDLTEGAFDDAMRHAITKMSHLHFVTHEVAARRVRQMGEDPARVFCVGSPNLDVIRKLRPMSRFDFERAIGFKLKTKNLLVTFHPPTLSRTSAESQFDELLKALGRLDDSVGLLFTKPNSDTHGLRLARRLERFAGSRRNAKVFASMGQRVYLSALLYVDAVIGNSSSGLYEAPSFKIPTVNIGDRQDGRVRASSIIDCASDARAISEALRLAFKKDCSRAVNPYGDGRSSNRIHRRLTEIKDPQALIHKHFFDMRGARR